MAHAFDATDMVDYLQEILVSRLYLTCVIEFRIRTHVLNWFLLIILDLF